MYEPVGYYTTSQTLKSNWTLPPSFLPLIFMDYLLLFIATTKPQVFENDDVIERNVVQSDVETANGLKLAACQLFDRCPVSLSFPLSSIFHGTP